MDTGSYSTVNAECGCPEPHDQAVDDESQPPWTGDVCRHLHYYSPPLNNERPKFIVTESNGVGYKNYPCINHPVLIRDLRMHPSHLPFLLSTHSFQLLRNIPPCAAEILDDEHMQEIYTASAAQIVLAHVPGARSVTVFDQTFRRASTSIKQNRPVRKVHVDQTPNAAKLRAKRHLSPQEADEVEQGKLRLRIINVWRPLAGPVVDHPLCLAESSSVAEEDLVEVDHRYVDRVGQTYAVRKPSQPGSAHRFWYLSAMEITDIWLIQCFDSSRDTLGRRLRCPHASFEFLEERTTNCCGQQSRREGRQRASVEVRCLVLGG
jgi:hypothetical protein